MFIKTICSIVCIISSTNVAFSFWEKYFGKWNFISKQQWLMIVINDGVGYILFENKRKYEGKRKNSISISNFCVRKYSYNLLLKIKWKTIKHNNASSTYLQIWLSKVLRIRILKNNLDHCESAGIMLKSFQFFVYVIVIIL